MRVLTAVIAAGTVATIVLLLVQNRHLKRQTRALEQDDGEGT